MRLAEPGKSIDEETLEAVTKTLRSGEYILGENLRTFEKEAACYFGTKYAVGMSSGTAALHVALLDSGITSGSEVITVSHTFIATANATIHAGAKPRFVDIDPDTYTMDCKRLESCISPSTKAIVPVHLYGHPADMEKIVEVAERHGLFVIEDGCQAHGALYRGRKVGSIGHIGCFSFYPSKPMTVCGDGGMIVTNDGDIADKAHMYRNHGRRLGEKYLHEITGFNYRMNETAATIGNIQLKRLEEWIERRRHIATLYNEMLDHIPEIRPPIEKEWAKHAYYVYTIRSKRRNELKEYLEGNGVETGIYYPTPIHLQPACAEFNPKDNSLPVTEQLCSEILSLPMHPYLTQKDIEYVTSKVSEFYTR